MSQWEAKESSVVITIIEGLFCAVKDPLVWLKLVRDCCHLLSPLLQVPAKARRLVSPVLEKLLMWINHEETICTDDAGQVCELRDACIQYYMYVLTVRQE